jgi:hypothetical protein
MICHRALGKSIRNCMTCRVLPWDRENGGGWLPCPDLQIPLPAARAAPREANGDRVCDHGTCPGDRAICDQHGQCQIGFKDDGTPDIEKDESYGTHYLTLREQRVMHAALRRSTRLIATGGEPPHLSPPLVPAFHSQFSGDICADCGSAAMIRTGTCQTCQACGSTSGGCS